MAEHDLRLRILNWVQEHHIQRYDGQVVVSHTEAVEDLLDVFFEEPGITNFSKKCAADHHQFCDGRDGRGARCHCECHAAETEESRYMKMLSRGRAPDEVPLTHRFFSSAVDVRRYFDEDLLPEEDLQQFWIHASDDSATLKVTGFFFSVTDVAALMAAATEADDDDDL